jgi:hypothetical protein
MHGVIFLSLLDALFLCERITHESLAALARINNFAFLRPDAAIDSWHKKGETVLAEFLLQSAWYSHIEAH